MVELNGNANCYLLINVCELSKFGVLSPLAIFPVLGVKLASCNSELQLLKRARCSEFSSTSMKVSSAMLFFPPSVTVAWGI